MFISPLPFVITAPALEIIFASCCAEVVQKAALHPIDSIKTRLQYDNKKRVAGRGLLFSDLAAGYKLLAAEPRPVRALYRGLGASVVGSVPTSLVYMPTYETAKLALAGTAAAPFAGVVTGCVSACVRVPTSVVKAQLQLGLHDSATSAVRALVKEHGPQGLFVGFRATVVLDVFYAVVQFAVLEQLRAAFVLAFLADGARGAELLSPVHNMAIGFLTGALTSAATEPVDVIRTRLMAQVATGGKSRECAAGGKGVAFGYNGLLDGLRQAAALEGVGALWKGLLPRLVLKSIGSSLWYAVYMAARGAFRSAFPTA